MSDRKRPLLIYSERQNLHDPDQEWNFGRVVPYPENENRGETITTELRRRGYGDALVESRKFDLSLLKAVHHADMVEHIRSCGDLEEGEGVFPHIFAYHHYAPERAIDFRRAGYFCFDVGTPIGRDTFVAAKAAVDVALDGAQRLLDGQERRVFSLCRPPGHHADYSHYGGYCYFNNAASAANLLAAQGKTAVLDLDYHHGNGTQGIFYGVPTVLYVSVHADPRTDYPYFCGFAEETGEGLGEGFNCNLPLAGGCEDAEYRAAVDRALERVAAFGPHHLVVSMGFDSFEKDPLGDFRVKRSTFRWIGRRLADFDAPTLVCLEGGYDVDDLGENAADFAEGFFGWS